MISLKLIKLQFYRSKTSILEDLRALFPDGKGSKALLILTLWGIMLFISAVLQILLAIPNTLASIIMFEENDPRFISKRIYYYWVWFVVIGFFEFILHLIPRWYLFNFSAKFVNQVRSKIYRVLIRQPIEFFEKSENSSGSITHILWSDVRAISNTTIHFISIFFHGFWIMFFSIIFWSFFYIWPSIASVVIMPFFVFSLVISNKIQGKIFLRETENSQKENMIISDSIINHLTISSLSSEDIIIQRYFEKNRNNNWRRMKYIIAVSFLYGLSLYLTQLVSYYIKSSLC